eukprot:1006662-Pelagomonas_calceolata.AAC.1
MNRWGTTVRSGRLISMNDFSADLRYRCKEFGEKPSQEIPGETTISLLLTKLGLLLLLHATLVEPMYPCLGVIATKLKMKHMCLLIVLMSTITEVLGGE